MLLFFKAQRFAPIPMLLETKFNLKRETKTKMRKVNFRVRKREYNFIVQRNKTE